MTVGDTPEQGGRDALDVLLASAWGDGMQELEMLMEYTEAVGGCEIPEDELELIIQGFLSDFSQKYPRYSHTEYEARVEAKWLESGESYLDPKRPDWSALHKQLTLIVNDFAVDLDPEDFSEDDMKHFDEAQLRKKVQLAGDYWFLLGKDAFWLIKMLDELCPTEPALALLPRDAVRTMNVAEIGQTAEQRALYRQCIKEFVEAMGPEVEEDLDEFYRSDDDDSNAEVRNALFQVAILNGVEVFEDAFNTENVPPSAVAARKTMSENLRTSLRMCMATIVCAGNMTVDAMLDTSQPYVDRTARRVFQYLYEQIINGSGTK